MPKKKNKGPQFTEEQKEAARIRMQKFWERKHKQEAVIKGLHETLEKVYMAGWKHNKAPVITFFNQMSVAQAERELTELFNEAFE
jgi:hypothetical protein